MAQLVEHHLAKVGVAGSSPVVRSRNFTAEANASAVFVFEYESGLEPMRWNSVKKTAQWAVLCQLAYNPCNYGFASLQRNLEQPENSHAGGLRRCAVHGGFCRVAWCACRYHETVDGLARYVAEILIL